LRHLTADPLFAAQAAPAGPTCQHCPPGWTSTPRTLCASFKQTQAGFLPWREGGAPGAVSEVPAVALLAETEEKCQLLCQRRNDHAADESAQGCFGYMFAVGAGSADSVCFVLHQQRLRNGDREMPPGQLEDMGWRYVSG
jgi:hypothetical protein